MARFLGPGESAAVIPDSNQEQICTGHSRFALPRAPRVILVPSEVWGCCVMFMTSGYLDPCGICELP